jgi:monoamine oxidase
MLGDRTEEERIREAGKCSRGSFLKLAVTKRRKIIVVGGGPAGCTAALSARRNGADVLLIEKESYLGGNLTNGLGDIGIKGYRAGTPGNPIIVKASARRYLIDCREKGELSPLTKSFPEIQSIWLRNSTLPL